MRVRMLQVVIICSGKLSKNFRRGARPSHLGLVPRMHAPNLITGASARCRNHEGAMRRCSGALHRHRTVRLARQVRFGCMPKLQLATVTGFLGQQAAGMCAEAWHPRCAARCASMADAARPGAVRACTRAGPVTVAVARQARAAPGARRDVLQCSACRSGPSGEQRLLVPYHNPASSDGEQVLQRTSAVCQGLCGRRCRWGWTS